MPKGGFWTAETALAALRYEAQRLGRTPCRSDMLSKDRTCPTEKVYRRLFGRITTAQRLAGLTPNKPCNTGWRKSHCKRGHPRIPVNVDTQGHCRLCAAHWAHRKGLGPMLPRKRVPVEVLEERRQRITERNAAYWGIRVELLRSEATPKNATRGAA